MQGQNGKEIFVMHGGRKRGLPNYDTFLALNLTMSDVRVISDRVGSTRYFSPTAVLTSIYSASQIYP